MRVQNPNIDLRSATTRLTSAQIVALKTTAITLVPAPGAGRIILVMGIALVYKFNTFAYVLNAGASSFQYNDAAHTVIAAPLTADIVLATASSFAYTPGTLLTPTAILPGADNVAAVLAGAPDYNIGPIVTTTLGAGGAGYAANDTGTLTHGANDATYKVLTVDGLGAVLTYQITAAGTDYVVENGSPTATGGAKPGVGVGFTVNITAIRTGDGTLKVVTYYQIIPVP